MTTKSVQLNVNNLVKSNVIQCTMRQSSCAFVMRFLSGNSRLFHSTPQQVQEKEVPLQVARFHCTWCGTAWNGSDEKPILWKVSNNRILSTVTSKQNSCSQRMYHRKKAGCYRFRKRKPGLGDRTKSSPGDGGARMICLQNCIALVFSRAPHIRQNFLGQTPTLRFIARNCKFSCSCLSAHART